jgi:integrase
LSGAIPRRYQRGTLRAEGRWWTLRIRGEANTEGARRPERSIRVGLRSELKTRPAARLEADRRLAMLGMADRQHGRRARLADYLLSYIAGSVATKRKSSRAAFASYGRHLERELGSHWLDQISIGVAQSMIARLLQRGLSPPTIYAIASFLRRLLKSARAEGIAAIVIGPRELSFPRELRAPAVARSFSIDETRRILAAATWPWKALFALQAYLGLRAGESLGLEWPQIDFAARQIRIRQQAAHGELATLKSRNSTAVLPLPDALAALLQDYRAHWTPNDRQLLFANKHGGVLWTGGVRRNHLQPLLKRLGIAPRGFHAWRHALATEAFRVGAGAAAVQRLLRHGSIAVTLRYSHVQFDDLVRSSDRIAKLLDACSEETQQCGCENAGDPANSEVAGVHALQLRSESTCKADPPARGRHP